MSQGESLVGQVLEDRYKILRLVGEGGMGVVYEAEHVVVGRRVAIKLLHEEMTQDPAMVNRFYNEARAAGSIGNEHIVEVLDFGKHPAPYLVMEYLEGKNLDAILSAEGPLRPSRAAGLLVQVLEGLSAAHAKQIVHRDLKPENILVIEKEGREVAKLLDFGISKLKGDPQAGHLTQTGTVLGTPFYMSPEQALGVKDLTGLTDIYSAGVILYQAVAGRLPFTAENYNLLLVKIISEPPTSPRAVNAQVPEDLERIILKAMAQDQAQRFQSSREFSDALCAFVEGRKTAVLPVVLNPTDTAARLAAARSRILAGAGALAGSETAMTVTGEKSAAEHPRARRGRLLPVASAAVVGLGIVAAALILVLRGGGGGAPPAPPPVPAAIGGPDATAPPPAGPSAPGGPSAPDAAVVATAAVPVAAGDPTAGTIRFRVSVVPAQAKVFLDGIEAPGNPVDLRFRKDGVAHTLRLAAEGYEEKTRMVVFDGDVEIAAELQPAPAVPSPAADAGRVVRPPVRPARDAATVQAPAAPDAAAPPPSGPYHEVDIDARGGGPVAPPMEIDNPYATGGRVR